MNQVKNEGLRHKLYLVWMEFFHIEIINGERYFKFSSKKFHFQVAQFMFYSSILLKVFAFELISERLTTGVLSLIGGHAISTGAWYTWRKKDDIKAASAN